MRLIIIRHAQAGRTSLPNERAQLTKTGIEQAKITGAYLSSLPYEIDAILSSPSQRAINTAENVRRQMVDEGKQGPQILVKNDLRERIEFYGSEYKNWREMFADYLKTYDDRDYKPRFGDTSRETGVRFYNALEDVRREEQYENIAVIAHGGSIRDYIEHLIENGLVSRTDLDDALAESHSLIPAKGLRNCSITEVFISQNGQYELRRIDDVSHIERRTTLEGAADSGEQGTPSYFKK